MSGGYRGPVNPGPPPTQPSYGTNYSGGNTPFPHSQPPPQQPYYGQPPPQPQQQHMYHQPMPNAYQQMGHIPRPINASQQLDTRGYTQPPQHQIPMQNRS